MNGVGTSGAFQHMYYTEVVDTDRVSEGMYNYYNVHCTVQSVVTLILSGLQTLNCTLNSCLNPNSKQQGVIKYQGIKSPFSNSSLSNIYTSGGGLIEEGEIVEVVEIPRDGIESFTFDETKPKPPGCMLACMWWLNNHSHLDK